MKQMNPNAVEWTLLDAPVPHRIWGKEGIEQGALTQLDTACRLPVSVRAAQMPDGHQGYGLPIGGVLATRNAVIPYAVGVDIGCRMKLSITDADAAELPARRDTKRREQLKSAILRETMFGMGAEFKVGRRQHDVMDRPEWDLVPGRLKSLKGQAAKQLGSSGSGNHFVEWVKVEVTDPDLGIPIGDYLGLLSHSGSRGFGAKTASYFTQLAKETCALPKGAVDLAWLSMDSEAGQQYWMAMNLAGAFASANHDCIHQHVLASAGLQQIAMVENFHNMANKELVDGEELIVHRKGATPAHAGTRGVIPGTMGDYGYVVEGLGVADSLNSAAHGAGRAMSRGQAMKSFNKKMLNEYLEKHDVELISAGIDEAPMAYKPIDTVMAAQQDLVKVMARITPRIVRMADDGTHEG